MATLLFCTLDYEGEFNGSLRLAKELKARGHRVCYMGLASSRESVETRGFEFVPILERWFKGNLAVVARRDRLLRRKRYERVLQNIAAIRTLRSLAKAIIYGEDREIQVKLGALRPDLMLISATEGVYATFMGIIAYECGIRRVCLSDTFTCAPPPRTPAVDAGAPEARRYLSRVKRAIYASPRKLIEGLAARLVLDFSYSGAFAALARRAGVPSAQFDPSNEIALNMPHLFLCPQAFELPGIVRPDCCYAEASIDLAREAGIEFDWTKLDSNKKLVFCSLGTTLNTYQALGVRGVERLYAALISAFALPPLRDEFQLVLAVSDYLQSASWSRAPSNVFVFNRVPQLAVLARSDLAVIAGGIHTTKECIFFGVPMIVLPIWSDQFDNAARVQHHRLGVTESASSVSPRRLAALIHQLSQDETLRQRLESWKLEFRAIEAQGRAVEFVSSMLRDVAPAAGDAVNS